MRYSVELNLITERAVELRLALDKQNIPEYHGVSYIQICQIQVPCHGEFCLLSAFPTVTQTDRHTQTVMHTDSVFSCVLNVVTVQSDDLTAAGRLFHIDGPETAKLLSP